MLIFAPKRREGMRGIDYHSLMQNAATADAIFKRQTVLQMKSRLISSACNQGKVTNPTARQANKHYKSTGKTAKKCVQNNSTTDRG